MPRSQNIVDTLFSRIGPGGMFAAFASLVTLCAWAAVFFQFNLVLLLPVLLLGAVYFLYDFRSLFYFLFALIPFSTEITLGSLGTNFPSEPMMLILMVGTLLLTFMKKDMVRLAYLTHPLIILLLLHLGWILIAAIQSEMFLVSFKYWLAKTWYYTVFVFLAAHLIRNWKHFEPLFWILNVSLGLAVLYVLARHSQYGFHFEFVNKSVWPIFRNHVDYAVMLAVLFPYLFFLRRNFRAGGLQRLLVDGLLILFGLGIVFSYTRAAYVSLMIIPVVYLVVRWRLVIPATLLSIVGFVALFGFLAKDNRYLDFSTSEDTVYHLNWSDHLTATFELKDMSTMERFYRWIAAVRMIPEVPITGNGPSTFYHLYKPYTVRTFKTYVSNNEDKSTTHNYYLMILVEQGWIGLTLFVLILLMFLAKAQEVYHRDISPEHKQLLMAMLVSSVIVAVNNLMADLIEVDKVGSFYFLHIALLINLDIDSKELEEKRV